MVQDQLRQIILENPSQPVAMHILGGEIRRTAVPGQPMQKRLWDPISREKNCVWRCTTESIP
jgi:hypothetical protein